MNLFVCLWVFVFVGYAVCADLITCLTFGFSVWRLLRVLVVGISVGLDSWFRLIVLYMWCDLLVF